MQYNILSDDELNVDKIMENILQINTTIPSKASSTISSAASSKPSFSESEIALLKKTPWTWYNISEELPKTSWTSMHQHDYTQENIDFLIELGYIAFREVITIDNTFKKALKSKMSSPSSIRNITLEELYISNKIKQLDKISSFMDLPPVRSYLPKDKTYGELEAKELFLDYKLRGWEIARKCYETIELSQYNDDEIIAFDIHPSEENKQKFAKLVTFSEDNGAVRSFLKGSYIEYIESERKSRFPGDIDISLIVEKFTAKKYFELIQTETNIEGIEVYPMVIPEEYINTHSFFDMDVGKNSKILYNRCNNDVHQIYNYNHENVDKAYIRKRPEKIIRIIGNSGVHKLRALASDTEEISRLCQSTHAHRKIYSALRQPEISYTRLKDNKLGHLVDKPQGYHQLFNPSMRTSEIQKLLIQSSIELSKMNMELDKYMNHDKKEV